MANDSRYEEAHRTTGLHISAKDEKMGLDVFWGFV